MSSVVDEFVPVNLYVAQLKTIGEEIERFRLVSANEKRDAARAVDLLIDIFGEYTNEK